LEIKFNKKKREERREKKIDKDYGDTLKL